MVRMYRGPDGGLMAHYVRTAEADRHFWSAGELKPVQVTGFWDLGGGSVMERCRKPDEVKP